VQWTSLPTTSSVSSRRGGGARPCLCPYSRFRVGAALLLSDGQCAPAAMSEYASFGLSVCARRNAVARCCGRRLPAASAALVVVTDLSPPASRAALPAGAAEFGNFPVILANRRRATASSTGSLAVCCPDAFDGRSLEARLMPQSALTSVPGQGQYAASPGGVRPAPFRRPSRPGDPTLPLTRREARTHIGSVLVDRGGVQRTSLRPRNSTGRSLGWGRYTVT